MIERLLQENLGAGGAALGEDGERGADDALDGVFGYAGEVFSEDARIREDGTAVGPAEVEDPTGGAAVIGGEFFGVGGAKFGYGDDHDGVEKFVESPDIFRTHKKLNGYDRFAAGLEQAAIDDDERAEFAGFFVGA
jgi:hypothetical protein